MRLKKQMIATGIVATLCLLSLPSHTKAAALQANGGEPAKKTAGNFLVAIRQMQEAGGALGLTDSINYDADNVKNSNLISNNTNLDIHMQKNTEYGAMVILSASSYGNPDKIEDKGTTTGNKTGVVMKINNERVSAALSNTTVENVLNASKRYWNTYQSDYKEKYGDAIGGINGTNHIVNWHGSTSTNWLVNAQWHAGPDQSVLLRAVSGSIFSCDRNSRRLYAWSWKCIRMDRISY